MRNEWWAKGQAVFLSVDFYQPSDALASGKEENNKFANSDILNRDQATNSVAWVGKCAGPSLPPPPALQINLEI